LIFRKSDTVPGWGANLTQKKKKKDRLMDNCKERGGGEHNQQ